LFFVADDGVHGPELWRSDGTEAGTDLVKDIHPSREASCSRCSRYEPTSLTRVGRRLFFVGDDDRHGPELWVSDGTERGTFMVEDLSPNVELGQGARGPLLELDGTVLFGVRDGGILQLWRSNGTARGTRLVKDIASVGEGLLELGTVAGKLAYFGADDGVHGIEPWRTDGTAQGTFMLRDIYAGLQPRSRFPGGSDPEGFLQRRGQGRVYFTADDGSRRGLWATDGTARGTVPVVAPTHVSMAEAGGTLFFTAEDPETGRELWASDGTAAGTRRVRDLRPGPEGSYPHDFAASDHGMFFRANDGVHGFELWLSDGTAEGTRLVRDLAPGPSSSVFQGFVQVGDLVYFSALSFGVGCRLWMSDGTEVGTQPVAGTEGLCASWLTASGRHLFFQVFVRGSGSELWALRVR
jgi:ELWxxDGT repeat protein